MLILMLFYQFYASLYEVVQSLTLQHAVLQQGKVDKLVDNLVALCVVCINLFLLLALIVEFLCYIGKSILVGLRNFLVLLALLCLFKALALVVERSDFCLDRRDGCACVSLAVAKDSLDEGVVAV